MCFTSTGIAWILFGEFQRNRLKERSFHNLSLQIGTDHAWLSECLQTDALKAGRRDATGTDGTWIGMDWGTLW
jgi:hypothetical protein